MPLKYNIVAQLLVNRLEKKNVQHIDVVLQWIYCVI